MTLADGHELKTEILTTTFYIGKGRVIPTKLIVLKIAEGNRTLLGANFESTGNRSGSSERTLVFLKNYSPTV
ncbi:hypothetical protein CEXT_131561 [Caerostris extrusa]|uniref:Uncharacterized protein n=1 Tax=Caerostris extrusa TaxID=172846 RepID=A0AAV4R2N0_CAEEX|nr:hypothetical protein CEXT_131561 [Caerostris extrusa]